MSELEPTVSRKKRISPLWIVPVVALVAGIWMVVQSYLSQGPTITIEFKTAEGLEEGKTKVKMLNVDVGVVEEVRLKKDVSGVTATVQLDKEIAPLLREGTQFWVVRARIGAGGVQGLGTILSGAYLELAPGEGRAGRREFVGLDSPPLTPVGTPGKRLVLTSERAAIRVGDPIVYQGFHVGRVESMKFDAPRQIAEYGIFIDAPYDSLIHSSTRFWDTSGISLDASADGVALRIGALDTVLLGGVAFETPPGMPQGQSVDDDAEFRLYANYEDILKNPYRFGDHYVVAFKQSLAGLVPGAPVSYRGIQVGVVERIMLREMTQQQWGATGEAIPVLIYLEPGRLDIPDAPASVARLHETISRGVPHGLRATLQTGNLVTGRKEVALDFYDNVEPAELGKFDQYVEIPSIETGVGRLEQQINSLLVKLNSLPLNDTVGTLNQTLEAARLTLTNLNSGVTSLNQVLAASGTQRLTGELSDTLVELRSVLDGFSQDAELYQDLNSSLSSLDQTLESLNRLAKELADKPSSVIFSSPRKDDPTPEARP